VEQRSNEHRERGRNRNGRRAAPRHCPYHGDARQRERAGERHGERIDADRGGARTAAGKPTGGHDERAECNASAERRRAQWDNGRRLTGRRADGTIGRSGREIISCPQPHLLVPERSVSQRLSAPPW
jgi:hypothetical protein